MKKLLFTLVAIFALSFAASAANYEINDNIIDEAIESAIEVTPDFSMPSMPAAPASVGAKNDTVALILNFFLGGFGIHRHYMGTAPWMWAAYTFTAGGIFGIVPMIDLIVEIVALAENGGMSQYYNNSHFIMWL